MDVQVREGEGFEGLLRRFSKGIQLSGVLREYRQALRFKSKAEIKRDKARAAARRGRKARSAARELR